MSSEIRTVGFCKNSIAGLRTADKKDRVLLVHGNSSCKEVFLPLINFLESLGIACLAIDLPGHGESTDSANPEVTYTFPGYADCVFEVLQEAEWPNCGLIGWSLGGHVAMECLSRDPSAEQFSNAIIIGAPPGKPSIEAFEAAFQTTDLTLLAGKLELSPAESNAYAAAMLGGEAFVTLQLLEAVKRTDGRARANMLRSALDGCGADQMKAVQSAMVPLALVFGANDPFIRLGYLDRIPHENLWGKKVQLHDNWGHAPHWQMDREFTQFLEEFYKNMD